MKWFVIICLSRSKFADTNDFEYRSDWFKHSNLCYWMPNRAGYTYDRSEAGIYSTDCLVNCAGDGWDWFAQPLYRNERGEEE